MEPIGAGETSGEEFAAQAKRSQRAFFAVIAVLAVVLLGINFLSSEAGSSLCLADQPIGLTEADYNNPPARRADGVECWNKKVDASIRGGYTAG